MAEIKELKSDDKEETDEIINRTRRIFSDIGHNSKVNIMQQYQIEIENLKHQLNEKNGMLEQAAGFGSQLVKEIDILKSEFELSIQNGKEKDMSIKRLENQIKLLTESEKQAVNEIEISHEKIDKLEQEIHDLHNENEIYKQERNRIHEEDNSIESQNKNLRDKLIQITNEKDKYLNLYKKEENRNEQLLKNNEELYHKLHNLEQENYEINEQNEELIKQNSQNTEFITQFQFEIDKLFNIFFYVHILCMNIFIYIYKDT